MRTKKRKRKVVGGMGLIGKMKVVGEIRAIRDKHLARNPG